MHKNLVKKLAALDIDRLHEVLGYDPKTGVLSWRVRLSPRCRLGEQAGKLGTGGYRQIAIDKRIYPAHHLAWFHYHGEPADGELDFINDKHDDTRIENLRLSNPTQRAQHRRPRPSKAGLKGATKFNSPRNLKGFRSTITKDGKRYHLGQFDTAEEAHRAYAKKAEELFGEFAKTK